MFHRVLYYNNVSSNTAQYTAWYPLLAMEGTPCTAQGNVRGVSQQYINTRVCQKLYNYEINNLFQTTRSIEINIKH